MKVIQFIHGLTMGGAETLVKDYCLMADENIEMVVVTTDPYCYSENEIAVREAGIRIISISERLNWKFTKNPIVRTYRHCMRKYWYSRELKKIIEEERPDVIHVHLALLKYLEPIINSLKDIRDIRIFYTCHNLPELFLSGQREDEGEAAKKLINQAGLRLIALHPQMAEELNVMFDINNTLVIRNGINFKRFQNIAVSKEKEREILSIPQDAFVIGHVGRFSKQKNHDFLIDIFYELTKRKENAFLLMVGDGELKADIINKLNSLGLSGRYLCLENRKDIPELMKAMDEFVFPSLYEGLGMVLVEAQVVGLKCIISNTIPDSVLLTDHIIPVSLEKSANDWCEVILNDNIHNTCIMDDISEYDMTKVIEKLEALYRGKA